jgi:hypothetical protein
MFQQEDKHRMSPSYKLSPSDLTFLWDECKRCFYLKVIHNFQRPRAPFPKIFGIIDRLMNSYFKGKRSNQVSSDLPDGVIEYGEKWVESHPIRFPGRTASCFLRGRFDTVIAFAEGGYAVVDFKTTKPTAGHVPFYSRQLHAYAYALEHPAPRKFSLQPVTRLGLLCVEPSAIDRMENGQLAYYGEAVWLEIPKDEEVFLRFLEEVMDVLENPTPPPPGVECGYCRYRESSLVDGW